VVAGVVVAGVVVVGVVVVGVVVVGVVVVGVVVAGISAVVVTADGTSVSTSRSASATAPRPSTAGRTGVDGSTARRTTGDADVAVLDDAGGDGSRPPDGPGPGVAEESAVAVTSRWGTGAPGVSGVVVARRPSVPAARRRSLEMFVG
jgi:hypothetical protein